MIKRPTVKLMKRPTLKLVNLRQMTKINLTLNSDVVNLNSF